MNFRDAVILADAFALIMPTVSSFLLFRFSVFQIIMVKICSPKLLN